MTIMTLKPYINVINFVVRMESNHIRIAARFGLTDRVKQLLRAKVTTAPDRAKALLEAARNGHKKIVRTLLKRHVSVHTVDRFGCNALMLGAYGNHLSVVRMLLHWGARVSEPNNHGFTALLFAVKGHSFEISKI